MTRITARITLVVTVLGLTACVPVNLAGAMPGKGATQPAMRWDHRPEAAEWTQRSLAAITRHDTVLAGRVPADIQHWCPGYEGNSMAERRAFWAGLLSAVAKYESRGNPTASGGGGRYIGLMQISPKSARNYDCTVSSAGGLKNGSANLECAIEMMAPNVARDGVVAGKGNRGIGRDWMPFRKAGSRGEMAAWTSKQSYCQ